MIKCDNVSVQITGNGIDVLSELGLLTYSVITIMQQNMADERAVDVVKMAIDAAIELSSQNAEQKRMYEVTEILNNMKKTEEQICRLN